MKKIALLPAIVLSLAIFMPSLAWADGKEEIPEEHQDKSMLEGITQRACGIKENLHFVFLNAKEKATGEIAQLKEKLAVIMKKFRERSDRIMALVKEEIIVMFKEVKEKASSKVPGYEEQVKKRAKFTFDKAKEFINSGQ